jgi:hypothetical protein
LLHVSSSCTWLLDGTGEQLGYAVKVSECKAVKGVVAARAEDSGCVLLLVAGVPDIRLLQLGVAGVADNKLFLLLLVFALPGVAGAVASGPVSKTQMGRRGTEH